jgi:hypothetical protein
LRGPVKIYVEGEEADLPTNGESIEYQVRSSTVPSEFAPLYFSGASFGQLLKNIVNGVYDEETQTRSYYNDDDLDEFAATTPPAAMKLTEKVDDRRSWIEEHIYMPLGAAPAIDEGVIRPVYSRPPAFGAVLPILNNDNITIRTDWRRRTEDAVSEVEFDYARLFLVDVTDEKGKTTVQQASRDVIIVHKGTSRMNRPLVYKPATVVALGTRNGGESVLGIGSEIGDQLCRARAAEWLVRFLKGSQTIEAKGDLSSDALKNARNGDWFRCQVTWLPDDSTLERSMDRVVQLIAKTPRSDGYANITLLDGGNANVELALPTVAPLAYDENGRVVVDMTDVPLNQYGRVEYAFADVEPAESDPAWIFLFTDSVPRTSTTPIVPEGKKVYVRYRGEAPGKRPTDWGPILSIDPSTLPVLTDATITIDPITGFGAVGWWGKGAPTVAVRIWWEDHAFGTEPTFSDPYIEVEDNDYYGIGDFDIHADPLRQLSVKIEPWDTFPTTLIGAVSGQPRILSLVYGDGEAPTGYVPFFGRDRVENNIPLHDNELIVYTSANIRDTIPVSDWASIPFVKRDGPVTSIPLVNS